MLPIDPGSILPFMTVLLSVLLLLAGRDARARCASARVAREEREKNSAWKGEIVRVNDPGWMQQWEGRMKSRMEEETKARLEYEANPPVSFEFTFQGRLYRGIAYPVPEQKDEA